VRAAFALLALAIATPCVAQQLTVQANERKYNGQVWDGAEVYGPIALPANTPPDLAVCVIPLRGPETCIERQDGRQVKSLCQNSYSCTFTLNVNSREPYGLLIYDIDLRYHDLVDTLIVVPDERMTADKYAPIEARLRELMQQKTLAFTPMEKDRRARATFVVTAARCSTSCSLSQAQVRFQ
jgi:hypothetical protein